MEKITKTLSVRLTDDEINSPEDIEIIVNVYSGTNLDEDVTYTITYSKTKET